jgi:hypothetical protein
MWCTRHESDQQVINMSNLFNTLKLNCIINEGQSSTTELYFHYQLTSESVNAIYTSILSSLTTVSSLSKII